MSKQVKKSGMMSLPCSYDELLSGVVELLEQARRTAVRSINSIMTATYWEIGRRIVENEQGGSRRAGYGEELLDRLSKDLSSRFGRGFGRRNLFQMRAFYLAYPQIVQTLSAQLPKENRKGKTQTASAKSPGLSNESFPVVQQFPLPWSHYVRLLSVEKPEARAFYEAEALGGGWSVRQLDRQISSLFYERTLLSRNKAAVLKKGSKVELGDKPTLRKRSRTL